MLFNYGYFVCNIINCLTLFKPIIRLHKHLDFPFAPKINEDGIRYFTNDMINDIIYIEK